MPALIPLSLWCSLAHARELTLWHAYRGRERDTLEALLAEWSAAHPDAPVQPLAVPYEGLSSKVEAAVPRGNGPDLFLYAHEKIDDWARIGIILPVQPGGAYAPVSLTALTHDDDQYGWPLACKLLGLYYNKALIASAPQTTAELLHLDLGAGAGAPATPPPGSAPSAAVWPLVYEVTSAYQNAAWLHGFGGGVLRDGAVRLDSAENVVALGFIQQLALHVVPPDPSGALVTQLFNEGKAATVINGPWFLGEIEGVDFGVAPLPVVSETGRRAAPYVTVEAVFLSRDSADARALGAWLTGPETAVRRRDGAAQVVANLDTPPATRGREADALEVFRAALADAVPMPTDPAFARTWEPLARALRRLARGTVPPEQAAAEAQTDYTIVSRPLPPAADPTPWLVGAGLLALGVLGWAARGVWAVRYAVRRWRHAYGWVAPASIGLFLLVIVPFAVGASVSLFEQDGTDWRFVGASHFLDILLARDFPLTSPLSFWFTLLVTVVWTATNVILHVTLGVALAMLLREPWVRLRGVFRAALILPWAVPSYITALAWKGMFHRQFGAINALLVALGLEPISWFAKWSTAFAANVATNTWLGFPFMMVVTLGALQSIPRDLEDAAEVDGASGWQRFRHVTLPLLKPALLPAVILGSVWTFNMFNVIYLVSAGEPDGSTDILISQAYRWAFTRGHRYGYAAAYALIIFGAMFLQGRIANRLTGRKVI